MTEKIVERFEIYSISIAKVDIKIRLAHEFESCSICKYNRMKYILKGSLGTESVCTVCLMTRLPIILLNIIRYKGEVNNDSGN